MFSQDINRAVTLKACDHSYFAHRIARLYYRYDILHSGCGDWLGTLLTASVIVHNVPAFRWRLVGWWCRVVGGAFWHRGRLVIYGATHRHAVLRYHRRGHHL